MPDDSEFRGWELSPVEWERYIAERNGDVLLAAIGKARTLQLIKEQHPEFHRICDVEIEGRGYRVCRLLDLQDRTERLFIGPTNCPNYRIDGVPYSIQGAALRHWALDEKMRPSKERVDWEKYRAPKDDAAPGGRASS
jgi:hypothetical protein